MLAHFFLARRVALGEKDFFLVGGSLSDHLTERVRDE